MIDTMLWTEDAPEIDACTLFNCNSMTVEKRTTDGDKPGIRLRSFGCAISIVKSRRVHVFSVLLMYVSSDSAHKFFNQWRHVAVS